MTTQVPIKNETIHKHFIQSMQRSNVTTISYGCEECGLELEEEIEELENLIEDDFRKLADTRNSIPSVANRLPLFSNNPPKCKRR